MSHSSGLIDPLVHLDDKRYTNVPEILARAADTGVEHVVWAGTEPAEDATKTIETSETRLHVWRALGHHPAFVHENRLQENLDALHAAIQEKRIVAVGEIGLDARKDMPDILLQEKAFSAQLEMARDASLPVIIHAAKAWGRVLMKLKHFGKLPAGGMLHAFSASAEMVPQFADLGLLMSFGGLVTHERAKKMRKALRAVPLELLAIESDGPDHPSSVSPRPLSEPSDLPRLFSEIGSLRDELPALLAIAVTRNLHQLFPEFKRAEKPH